MSSFADTIDCLRRELWRKRIKCMFGFLPYMIKKFEFLLKALLEAREERQLQRWLNQFEKQDLLILDELGYVPFSKAGSELLFEVVSRAYERQSLIITTNLPFENWTEVCGSERLTGAMLDRLTHRVHIIEANGASYRLEQSRKRLAKQKYTILYGKSGLIEKCGFN